MKVRIRFKKYGAMKFIGHLDLLRYFQKAFRRAGFEMEYSKGFNPHQTLSFAAPLAIGYTSDSEYVDINILETIDEQEAVNRLNAVVSEGIEITEWKYLSETAKNAMSMVCAAKYKITLLEKCPIIEPINETITNLMNNEQIVMLKVSKNNEKEEDIKPGILHIEAISDKEIDLLLATGSVYNLKPELVMEAFFKCANIEHNAFYYSIHRYDIFSKLDGSYVPLIQII